MKPNQKLYLVSHKGLLPGAQAVQACHALREFVAHHSQADREWYEKSNHLCFLTVDNEEQLTSLMKIAIDRKIRWAAFQEPAMGMAYTAVAFEATDEVMALLSGLSLALSEYNQFHDPEWSKSQPKTFSEPAKTVIVEEKRDGAVFHHSV